MIGDSLFVRWVRGTQNGWKKPVWSVRLFFPGLFLVLLGGGLTGCEPEDLLSKDEVAAGLKQALEVGTDTASTNLNKRDGYFLDQAVKVLLPPEAAPILDRISLLPGGKLLLDNTIEAVNRAAEDAAVEAKPIFVDAITSITINDAVGILKGADNAATEYLKGQTYEGLSEAFQPKIKTSLEKPLLLNQSPEKLYGDLIELYNKGSLQGFLYDEVTDNSLASHTTTRALDGLFLKVADQEKDIRDNPAERVTEVLRKVFAEDAEVE